MNQKNRAILASVVALILLGSASLTLGQSYCDTGLQLVNGELGYRDRGDRCEGLYVEKVGGTTLLLASITESFEKFDARSGKPLHLEWDVPVAKGTVRLRAQGINPRLYYRMDTIQTMSSSSYDWPSSVLASLGLGNTDIGVLAFTKSTVGHEERDIYLPLRITQTTGPVRTGLYKILLVPGVEFQEVFITIGLTDANGRTTRFIKDREKLGYGIYPAGRIIGIPISGLTTPGIYFAQIGATLKVGGSASLNFLFYHSKR